MGTVERREREREQTHDKIIDAAVEIFLNEGYENTSIRKIAEKIEYTPGAIYSYFKDKDEILYEIHLRGFTKFFQVLQEYQTEANPLARLHKLGDLYLKFAAENPKYYDLMFIEESTARVIMDRSCWESGEQAHAALVQLVTECMEQGYLPKGDPSSAALAFWALVHGLTALVLRKRCPVDKEFVLPTSLPHLAYDYFWQMLAAKQE